jgi:hypothetical protein
LLNNALERAIRLNYDATDNVEGVCSLSLSLSIIFYKDVVVRTLRQQTLELVNRDIGLDCISRHAIRVQKYYMGRCIFMGPNNTTVQQFVERLNELNPYLLLS